VAPARKLDNDVNQKIEKTANLTSGHLTTR
jgi:hypothetical protein